MARHDTATVGWQVPPWGKRGPPPAPLFPVNSVPGLPGLRSSPPTPARLPSPPGPASALLTWPPPRRPLSLCSRGHCYQTCDSGRAVKRAAVGGPNPPPPLHRGGSMRPREGRGLAQGHTASPARRQDLRGPAGDPCPTAHGTPGFHPQKRNIEARSRDGWGPGPRKPRAEVTGTCWGVRLWNPGKPPAPALDESGTIFTHPLGQLEGPKGTVCGGRRVRLSPQVPEHPPRGRWTRRPF